MPMTIGSSQKVRAMAAADSKDLKAVAEEDPVAAEEVKARSLPVKMAACLHVPMVPFSTEKV